MYSFGLIEVLLANEFRVGSKKNPGIAGFLSDSKWIIKWL
jgi:hypothetical protein